MSEHHHYYRWHPYSARWECGCGHVWISARAAEWAAHVDSALAVVS